MNWLRSTFVVFAILSVATLPVRASVCDEYVDVALVLAIDRSGSTEEGGHLELQRTGYVKAFGHPEVVRAILGGGCGRIAVTVFMWSHYLDQEQIIPWSILDSREKIQAFASRLAKVSLGSPDSSTAICMAIQQGVKLFRELNYKARRKIIDISGDGDDDCSDFDDDYPSGEEPPNELELARAFAEVQRVTINGLAIRPKKPNPYGYINMYRYYEANVKTSDGFVMDANAFQDYALAVRRKLILEIAGLY